MHKFQCNITTFGFLNQCPGVPVNISLIIIGLINVRKVLLDITIVHKHFKHLKISQSIINYIHSLLNGI
jgi:hypothetical protein